MAYASMFRIVRTRVSGMILLAICLTVGGYPIRAAGQEKEAAACSSETTTAAMQHCENLRYQKAQQDLDSAYAELMCSPKCLTRSSNKRPASPCESLRR